MDPQILIAVVAPVLVALLRKAAIWMNEEVPSYLLPLVAPVLGALVDVILSTLGVTETVGLLGAAGAGMAGIGLREIVDQARKAIS